MHVTFAFALLQGLATSKKAFFLQLTNTAMTEIYIKKLEIYEDKDFQSIVLM